MSCECLDQRELNKLEHQMRVGGFGTWKYASEGRPNHPGDGTKFERTVDEGVKMCDIEPFPKRRKNVAFFGIVVRCVRWTDKVCVCG